MKGLRFLVSVDGGDETRFTVVRFSGEEAVSSLFSLVLQVVSDDADIAAEDIVGHDLRLRVLSHERDRETVYHGLATSFGMLHTTHGLCLYEIGMSSHLWPLTQTEDNRIFLSPGQSMDDRGTPLRDVLKDALTGTGASPTTFDFSGIQTDFSRRYVCQYRETHMHFVDRWLEYLGASYYFDHAGNTDRLVALDSGEWPRLGELPYREISGLPSHGQEVVWALAEHWQQVPAQVMIKDYNPDRPTVLLQASAPVSPRGHGTVYIYDDDPRSPEEARFLAGLRADALAACEHTLRGRATITGMRAGHVFSLREHPRQEMNKDYLVLRVVHRGSQAGLIAKDLAMDPMGMDDTAAGESSYRCEFSCIRLDRTYRPPRRTDWPEVIGTLNAKVDAAGSGEYAELDRHGRYKVIMPFDESGRSAAQASCFLRMAQPYAGSHNGMHFPLLKGSEVGIAFTGGNVDRPYIECALPNARNISVSTERNQSQGKIVSLAGNTVLYEDLSGRERIEMHNPDTESLVVYGHFQSNTGILKSTPHTYADFVGGQRHIVIDGAGSYDGKAAGLYRYVGGDFFMQIQSANRIEDTAGYQTQQTMLDRNATIAGNRTLDVASNTELVVHDNLTEEIGGNRTITAKNMSLTTVTDYWHSNAQGNMTWTTATRHTDAAATSMDLQAPNISMTSQQHMEEVTNTYTENTVLRTITTIQNQQDMKKLFKLGLLNLTVCPLNVASNSLSGKICAVANISLEGTAIASTLLKIDIMVDKVSVTGPSNSTELVKISTKGKKTDIAPIRQLCLGAVFGWAGITNGLLNPLWVAKEVFLDARMFWPFLANLGINVTHFIAADNVKSAYENMVDNMTNVTYPQTSATVNPVSLVPKPQPQSQNTGTTGTAPLSDTERLAQNQSTAETLSESMDDAHEDARTSADNAHASHAEPDWMAPVPPVDNSILQSWNAPVPEDRPFTLLPEIPDGNP